MTTRPTVALVWLLLNAAHLAPQEPSDATSPRQPLERHVWVQQFCERFEAIGPEADAANDPEIVRLVTAYTWHAVPQAIDWLDATDPQAERQPEDPTPELLRARVRPIALVMARELDAPGLAEILERVGSWTAQDWQDYRDTRRLGQEADALFGDHEWATAGPKYREMATRTRRLGRMDRETVAKNMAGLCEYTMEHLSEATELFERALKLAHRLGNEADIVAAHGNLGNVFYSRGHYEKAIDHQRRALAFYEKVEYEAGIAKSLDNLGSAFESLGRHEEALGHHRRALELRKRIGNDAETALSLNNLGNTLSSLGLYAEALTHYRSAFELFDEIGSETHVAALLTNLGSVFNQLGRHEEALHHHRRALELHHDLGNDANTAASLNSLGNLYYSLGRYEEAVDHHRRALELFEKSDNKTNVAASLNNLGNALDSLGRHDESLGHHRRALELREEIGNDADIATSLNNIGNVFYSLDQYEEALGCYRRALELDEKGGNEADIAASLNNLGNVCSLLGRYEEALGYQRRALELDEKIGNQAYIASSLRNLASTMSRLGHVGEARQHFADALEKVRSVRENLIADRDRIAFLETWHRSLIPVLESALARGSAKDVAADAPLALRAVETLRGMATADLLQASRAGVELDAGGEVATEVVRLENQLEALEDRVRETYETAEAKTATDTLREDLRARQRELEKRWQDAVERLRRKSPEWASLKRPEPVELDELCALLPEETAYVAFALGKEASFLLLVDPDGLQHWRLEGEETIETAIRQHLELLATGPRTGARLGRIVESGRQLYDLLLGPAEEALHGYDTLLVSAEGLLWGLPLETLVTGGEGSDPRTAPYLLEKHAIVYVHSASVWGIHGERRKERRAAYAAGEEVRPTETLVLADPIVPGEAAWQGKAPLLLEYAARRSEPIGRLPFTRVEGFSVATSLADLEEGTWRFTVDGQRQDAGEFLARLEALRAPGAARDVVLTGPGLELRVGAPASKETLTRQRLQDVRFLHLATHAHLDESSPGLSGMWLSPMDEQDSGFLRLSDVMGLGLRAELVTLSGCETALGKATVSEGYQGLVRAFLFAGAENVLASAWRVDDAASAELLSGLYHSLRTGDASAAAAVQRMKRDYLRRVPAATPEKAHPYYWGAWMLWGTGVEAER